MMDFASPNEVNESSVLCACVSVQLDWCYRTSEIVSTPTEQHDAETN